jgi:hypothetical protein
MRAVALSLAGIAGLLALPASAVAATHTLDFDSTSPGTVVSSGPGGLSLEGSPVVFSAGSNAASAPNALRRQGNCPNSGATCTTGDHRLVMTFSNPARTVSLRAGIPATSPCNSEFDCFGRFAGFDNENDVVAITPWTSVGAASMSATFPLDADSHQIVRAVYSIGEDPETGDSPPFDPFSPEETAQIDNLTYDVLEPGETPPPPTTPPAPTVNITDPPAGQEFATTDVTVSGRFTAGAGLADSCVAANSATPATEFPAVCRQAATTRSDGSFSSSRIPGMRPGANEIRVWVRDTRGRVASDSVAVEVAAGDVDFAIESLEVTQAVQVKQLPVADEILDLPDVGPAPGDTYDGVPLAQDKLTTVRLFGEARGAAGTVRGTPALLHGYRRVSGGRLVELPESPLLPYGNPDPIAAEADLPALRASPGGGWTFLLPSDWTHPPGGELVLAGEIAPTSIATRVEDCCNTNNFFALREIEFTRERSVRVYPISLTWRDAAGNPMQPPDPLVPFFDDFRRIWPGPVTITPTLSAIDVTDLVDDEDPLGSMNARLYETFRDSDLGGKVAGIVVGINGGKGPGPTSVTSPFNAGLDFVAHEVGHSIGLAHAHSGNGCTDDDGDGVFDGPVSRRGPINGVGLDSEFRPEAPVGRFQPIGAEEAGVFDATPDGPDNVYDYMSYCSNEFIGKSWVSTGYWANQVRELRRRGRLITGFEPGCCFLGAASDPTVASARVTTSGAGSQPILRVTGLIHPDGSAEFTGIETARGRADPAAGGSNVQIVVRDRSGAEISRTPVRALPIEGRPAPGETEGPPSSLVSADVPGAGAARVDLVVGGTTVASRSASAAAPKVNLQQPRTGARIGSKRFRVAWNASDADGGSLTARVEFSADGGRSWEVLARDISGEKVTIPGSQLARARNGTLRVVVNDGFNSASDAARVNATGSPPDVTIASPPNRTKVESDTMVVLEGFAFDDAGDPIAGKRLLWSSGKRRLGRGERVDVDAHELRGKVTLSARDAAGRTGRDTVRLRVKRVAPVLTLLDAKPLGRKADALRLLVESSLPARLAISGAGLDRTVEQVGSRPETVAVDLAGRPRERYRVRLRLAASGRSSSVVLPVERRGR